MNNEPVAWMDEDENVVFEKCKVYPIPLYTHPSEHDLGIAEAIGFDKGYKVATAKTLTDEEIAVLIAPVPIRPSYEDLDKFARAILKKASEK